MYPLKPFGDRPAKTSGNERMAEFGIVILEFVCQLVGVEKWWARNDPVGIMIQLCSNYRLKDRVFDVSQNHSLAIKKGSLISISCHVLYLYVSPESVVQHD